jgi:hypothetical protein
MAVKCSRSAQQPLTCDGERAGWRFHIDGMRLNTRGDSILTDVVQQFLDSLQDRPRAFRLAPVTRSNTRTTWALRRE